MVSEDQVLKIPPGLPVDAAATVSVNPCTAFRMLKDFEHLEPGIACLIILSKVVHNTGRTFLSIA